MLEAVAQLVQTSAGIVNAAIQNPQGLTEEVQQRVQAVLNALQNHVAAMIDKIKELQSLAPPLPPAIDPDKVLEQISKGLRSAEIVLNGENLAILNGTIEATLNVQLPDGKSGATAHITFQIAPKPQA